MSDTNGGVPAAEKLSLKTLDKRIRSLEEEVSFVESVTVPAVSEEQFYDLLDGVLEALVRTRSAGAFRTAEKLRDKYLDPDLDIVNYGEQVVSTRTLLSAEGA